MSPNKVYILNIGLISIRLILSVYFWDCFYFKKEIWEKTVNKAKLSYLYDGNVKL